MKEASILKKYLPQKKLERLCAVMIVTTIILLGIGTGFAVANVSNIGILAHNSQEKIALPTKVLDRNNKLITTFFSNENRTLVTFRDMPRLLMLALITREDQTFLSHNGFSVRGTSRAVWNLISNNYVSGGSTLSQQVAGMIYADRREFSLLRKLKELWWSFNIERSWSKQEIIVEYLNKVYFGHGNYGAETASQYFFDHGAKELNYAEAVMLVIQLANPVRYSPFKNPNIARERQKEILDQMVSFQFIEATQATDDFNSYWSNYDYTRAGISSAFLERDDKAPYFSEYIRSILINDLGFSNIDINTGGYTIYTTLDLDIQEQAHTYFDEGLDKTNGIYVENQKKQVTREESIYPLASLATLFFDNTEQLFEKTDIQKKVAIDYFNKNLQPSLSAAHLLFDPSPNSLAAQIAFESRQLYQRTHQEETVEGALITLDNNNGYIVSMIGGSKFDATNQFNRAVNAFVQPGSSFKPLYYSAAVEKKLISPSTIIWDSPVVFYTEEGEPYVPKNYKGEWKGKVTVREALSRSMNVPSLKVLNTVGFPDALKTAAGLLDLPKQDWEKSGLVPKYPIGLGIVSVAPLSMAKAYATIANGGRKMTPIAIRYIKNRDGKITNQTEKEIRTRANLNRVQIISNQTAYIMTSILESTVQSGTLSYARLRAGGFTQATAGKTGTTQNWSDSWTLGFTPYYTTAIWFGFDKGGQSLGTNQTGALTTGPVWGQYMESINKDLPYTDFKKPQGIVTLTINPDNNKRAVVNSPYKTTEIFIAGTEPSEFDTPENDIFQENLFEQQLEEARWKIEIPNVAPANDDAFFEFSSSTDDSSLPSISNETFSSINTENTLNSLRLRLNTPSSNSTQNGNNNTNTRNRRTNNNNSNPFLD